MSEEQQDVEQNLDSSPQEQEIQQTTETQETQESNKNQEAASPEEKQIPFHEHPRFKEVIEQKNLFKQQVEMADRRIQDMERRFAEMTKQQEAARPKPQDALLERLKGIDPEFAERIGKLNKVDAFEQQLQEFSQWRTAEAQRVQQLETRNNLERLFTESSVPKELRGIYEDRLMAASNRNPELTPKDLPTVFKNIHDEMSKLLETTKRETTKSYVTDKKAQANRPTTQPKGKPANNTSKQQFNKDPQQARAEIIKQILEETRAEKDI